MTTPPSPAEESLDLVTILGRLRSNSGTILATVLLFLVLGLGYTFLSPPKYEARMTLYFPAHPQTVLGTMGVSTPDSGLSLGGLGGGPTSLKIFRAFLSSETCMDYVERKAGMDRKKIEDARSFTEDSGANTLTVSEVLSDADMAKKILQYHLEELSTLNEKISSAYLQDDTLALEQELNKQRQKLGESEQALIKFQKRADSAPTTVPSVWGQHLLQAKMDLAAAKSALGAASRVYQKSMGSQGLSPSDIPPVQMLRPKLVEAEYKLKILNASLGPDSPDVRHLSTQIEALKSELKSEVTAFLASVKKGMVDPTKGANSESPSDFGGVLIKEVALESDVEALSRLAKVAPSEEGQLAHLALQVSIESELVKYANLQLESARLQSLRDPNKWSVLDSPRIMPKPTNKKYAAVAAFSLLAGLLLSFIWAVNFGRRPGLS